MGAAIPPQPSDRSGGTSGGSGTPAPSQTDQTGAGTAFAWILAWAVILVSLFLVTRTRIGYVVVYYALALMLIFLFVTNAGWFASALSPFTNAVTGKDTQAGAVASAAGGNFS